MASDTSAAKRAYDRIKKLVMEGGLPVRSRIDIAALARDLGLSSMPVRQALGLLTWERMIRSGAHGSYEVALWSEAELAHLYEWRGALLTMALPIALSAVEAKRVARTQPYEQAVFNVMRLIDAKANVELRRAAINADERLNVARLAEAEVLGDVTGEFETLLSAIAECSRRTTTLIKAYHRRRVEQAGVLRQRVVLQALPSNGGPR
jgi:hypothetical protein